MGLYHNGEEGLCWEASTGLRVSTTLCVNSDFTSCKLVSLGQCSASLGPGVPVIRRKLDGSKLQACSESGWVHKIFSTVPATQQVTTSIIISAVALSLPMLSLSLSPLVPAAWELCQRRRVFLTDREGSSECREEKRQRVGWRQERGQGGTHTAETEATLAG